ncbi:hypothetical protein BUALT_Bualt07G0113200 [Buddleja alternifolia]|uniref:Uncharacterized protein n=1 Tax=Buddleja alternifolia TaxID=168488 RepID=A0AAV6XED2_9LAMI|nr:hypothetical protein BUALT_Bualt07G0113200 [Buddleja alternifolia]
MHSDLGRYLGVPIVHERSSPRLYQALIDKVQERLSAWKTKTLNMAGRVTLIQSVESSMPTHVMQTAWLPAGVCNKLDQLNRTFLWGGDSSHKKYHLVKWEDVIKQKVDEGLGLRETRSANAALLAKIGAENVSIFNGIKISRGSPSISHVMYADDLLICGWDC